MESHCIWRNIFNKAGKYLPQQSCGAAFTHTVKGKGHLFFSHVLPFMLIRFFSFASYFYVCMKTVTVYTYMEPSIFGFFYYFVVVWVMAFLDVEEVLRKLYVLIGCYNADVYLYWQIKIAVFYSHSKPLPVVSGFISHPWSQNHKM